MENIRMLHNFDGGKLVQKVLNYLSENKELLNSKEFMELYAHLNTYPPDCLTYILLNSHIDPLPYMNKIVNDMYRQLSIEEIIIPGNITSIGSGSFLDCEDLKKIDIPGSVNSIGYSAFDGCRKLTSVKINEGVEHISRQAFANCASLKEVTLPSTLNYIGNYAFYKCDYLTSVIYNGTEQDFKNITFARRGDYLKLKKLIKFKN